MRALEKLNGFIFGLLIVFLTTNAHANNVHGVLRVVKGDVQIKSGTDGTVSKAKLGGKVFPKDIIITGKDSRAKIVMVDNNELNLSPDSQIELQKYDYNPAANKKDVLLNVIYGKVRSKVEQKYDGKSSKFQVKTPSAVAGVRGTDFMTSYNRETQSSNIVTFEGRVEFGLPGPGNTILDPVSVTPGKTASNTPGEQPSAPAPVPREEMAKMDNESKAEPPKEIAPEERRPADDSKQPKEDGPKANDDTAAAAPGPGGDAPASGDKNPGRDPSSISPPPPAGGGSMMLPEDLAGSPNSVMPTVNTGPAPPPNAYQPVAVPPPVCTACNDQVSKKTGKVIVTISP